ncbi:hypothetical protein TDB9533_02918 [Thalassocella blandensis]|nr:hypothetical protein TDB9533_02918 [Thalassocella blandensis]
MLQLSFSQHLLCKSTLTYVSPFVVALVLAWSLGGASLVLANGLVDSSLQQVDVLNKAEHDHRPIKPFRVAFINPGSPGNRYWDRYVEYMRVAADSLHIDLHVEYAEGNRMHTPELASKLLSQPQVPDYLVYIFQYGQTLKVLNMAEQHKVKSFIVNTNVTDSEQSDVGKPRELFKYWIGHLHANNEYAGEHLAAQLSQEANQRFAGEDVRLLAISGSRDSTAAIDFNKGLANALKKDDSILLEQLVFSNWYYSTAMRQAEGLLLRYPQTQIMWSIGEDVALGAIDGAILAGRKPGVDIVIGGTVSTAKGVEAIEKGLLTANMGGDSWEGARALVMLFDFHHGVDFADDDFSVQYTTEYVTQENVAPFKALISQQKWQYVDYRKMSRYLNPTQENIAFNVNNLINAAEMGVANRAITKRDGSQGE